MILTNLKLQNFRNYKQVQIEINRGLNLIVGENASGKTNIVESIYFLSSGRSFRTNIVDELINNDSGSAVIDGEVLQGNLKCKLKAVVEKEKRHFFLNGREVKKVSELAKTINVLVFEPRDVQFFKEGPRVRRNYMDIHLSKMYPTYFASLSRYNKLLQERNELLRSSTPNDIQLETIEDMMCDEAFVIYQNRKRFLKSLEPLVGKVIKAISGKSREINLRYLSEIEEDDKSEYKSELKKAFKKTIESDLKYRVTSIGIHREDFLTELNGQKIAAFGSQGEKRLVALAIKIAPYFLIEEKEDRPIVILDDVLSELDEEHASKLIAFFSKFEQVFITGTKFENYDASFYEVSKQNIRRINYGR